MIDLFLGNLIFNLLLDRVIFLLQGLHILLTLLSNLIQLLYAGDKFLLTKISCTRRGRFSDGVGFTGGFSDVVDGEGRLDVGSVVILLLRDLLTSRSIELIDVNDLVAPARGS